MRIRFIVKIRRKRPIDEMPCQYARPIVGQCHRIPSVVLSFELLGNIDEIIEIGLEIGTRRQEVIVGVPPAPHVVCHGQTGIPERKFLYRRKVGLGEGRHQPRPTRQARQVGRRLEQPTQANVIRRRVPPIQRVQHARTKDSGAVPPAACRDPQIRRLRARAVQDACYVRRERDVGRLDVFKVGFPGLREDLGAARLDVGAFVRGEGLILGACHADEGESLLAWAYHGRVGVRGDALRGDEPCWKG